MKNTEVRSQENLLTIFVVAVTSHIFVPGTWSVDKLALLANLWYRECSFDLNQVSFPSTKDFFDLGCADGSK